MLPESGSRLLIGRREKIENKSAEDKCMGRGKIKEGKHSGTCVESMPHCRDG